MKHFVLAIVVTLNCQGCNVYMFNKMVAVCDRNGGVAESEVSGGYMRVRCKDGTIKTRVIQ